MQKIIYKILNIITILLVIANLISYQFILPVQFSRAQEDTSGTTADTTVDSGSSSSSDTTDKTDKTDKTNKTDDSKPSTAADNTSTNDVTDKTSETDATTATDTAPATDSSTDTANNTAATNAADTTTTNTAPLTTATTPTDTTNLVNECACKDKTDYNFLKEDCDKTYPDECQCFIDYCKSISSTNVTQNSSNIAASDSVSGGNTIAGDPKNTPDPTTPVPATDSADNKDKTDTNNTTDTTDKDKDKTDTASVTINTGDAAAQSTAINTVNTNIYTENGVQVTKTITGDSAEDVNLLDTFNNILESAKNLHAENGQVLEHIVVTNVNVAKDVENSATANADSGNNTIKNADGTASINSGNAAAVASAVNLINTNIVGNTWLVGIINVVGNWSGNLIVPGSGLLKTPLANLIFEKIVNINDAKNVENTTSANANTGNNSISGSENANIQTGDAAASANGLNMVNTNIVRNNWFFLMINNGGNWTGRVINWDGDTGQQSTMFEYDFGSLDEGCGIPPCANSVSVYNYNSAENVRNTVMANANTGNNSISGSGGASILTGNAGAWASAINLVNTNIVGNNWIFGIVNNAGNWSGNVIFGYPDLAVTLNSDKNSIEPGEDLHYKITYKNVGQAKCDNVDLRLALPSYLIYQSDTNGSGNGSGNDYEWNVSGLKPGEEKSFQVDVKLAKDVPQNTTAMVSMAGVKTETKEVELSNNTASESVNVAFPLAGSDVTIEDAAIQAQKDSDMSISRKDDAVVAMGNITTHYIYVKNSGKYTLYNILATEIIKDPSGKKAAEYSWTVPKLKKGQQAIISYQIFMGPQAQLGIYKHSASAIGYNQYGFQVDSGKVKGETNLVAGSFAGSVSGESQEIIPPAEAASSELPQTVLGVETVKTSLPWGWLFLFLIAPVAYFIKRKELYRWQRLQRMARQMGGFLSSFLS